MSQPLVVSRTIRATPQRLFDAWTDPRQLVRWWGPAHVECVEAEVDLREGGRYRLENRVAGGGHVTISGEFIRVRPPDELVYTWSTDDGASPLEQVTVRFVPAEAGMTVVEVQHARIADVEVREQHAVGWEGCFDGLSELVEHTPHRLV